MSSAKKLKSLLWRGKLDRELDEEMCFHVEQRTRDNIAAGMSPKDAREAALRAFGGVAKMTERCRESRGVHFIESLGQDFRYALRTLSKDRRFALLAILALALGIGASTVIFSAFYGLWLNTFPYKDPSGLITFRIHSPSSSSGDGDRDQFSLPEFLDYREQNHAFASLEGTLTDRGNCRSGNASFRAFINFTSANSLRQVGVSPAFGSLPRAVDEAEPPPVVAISTPLWRDEFNSDSKALGAALACTTDSGATGAWANVSRKIVAVMPPSMSSQYFVWIPFPVSRIAAANDPLLAAARMGIWGRLKPGVTVAAAGADLDVIAHRIAPKYSRRYPKQFSVIAAPITDAPHRGRPLKRAAVPFLVAMAMLLLIACSNVANLLLSRATVRDKEMAVRESLGAGRARLIRQLLVESFVLSCAACLCACALAYWGTKDLIPFLPDTVFRDTSLVRLNAEVLLFSLILAVLCTFLCGLSPALRAVRGELQSRLASTNADSGAGFRRGKMRAGLVIGEVMLSVVLLISAGIIIHVSLAVTHADLGYDPNHLYQVAIGSGFAPAEKTMLLQQALQRVAKVPGVKAAALSEYWPGGARWSGIAIPGIPNSHDREATFNPVSEGYFRTIGITVLHGRALSPEDVDSARKVIVVNENFAMTFFGKQTPIGRKVRFKSFDQMPGAPHDAYFEIVGIVPDVRGIWDATFVIPQLEPQEPQAFLPYTVIPSGESFYFRTTADARNVIPRVREQLRSVDSSIPLAEFVNVRQSNFEIQHGFVEFTAIILGAFSVIGLVLVLTGIFSVMAYNVSLQTQEIGVRMAFGAQPDDVLRMVIGKGALLIGIGIAVGSFGALALTRVVSSLISRGQFDGVMITDPWAFGAVMLLIVATGLAACYFPARRAARVDPLVALRHE